MDTVRFGRALGFGARQAAKTVIRAVDAARAENPSAPTPSQSASNPAANAAPVQPSASSMPANQQSTPTVTRSISTAASSQAVPFTRAATQARGLQEGLNRFKSSAVEPAVRLSAVLWLEVMGAFFGLFALAAGSAIWRLRTEFRPAFAHPTAHGSLLGAAAIFALFAYFSISSFVRARRRQRRRR